MNTRHLLCVNTQDVWPPPSSLTRLGWRCYQVGSHQEALSCYERHAPRVGLVLLKEPGCPALENLLRHTSGTMVWIALADPCQIGQSDIQMLLLNYCFDYHSLPVENDRLMAVLGHAFGIASLRAEARGRKTALQDPGGLVGQSPAMGQVLCRVEKLARVDSSVLLLGESGTGKELVARRIHRDSLRAKAPFVAVNCGAISPTLIQSELFGHEKGAFTGACRRHIGCVEAAHRGVLFLDEIGDLPLPMQVNLLRFLQERTIVRVGGTEPIEVDTRVITATHRDLKRDVEQGLFREDLYYRLCVLELSLPPLRERSEDLQPLANHFLGEMGAVLNPRVRGFTVDALRQILSYHWPGNVRELKNRLERALVLCEGPMITPADLGLECPLANLIEGNIRPMAQIRAQAEHDAVCQALERCGNNVSEAARSLGISRPTLYRILGRMPGLDERADASPLYPE